MTESGAWVWWWPNGNLSQEASAILQGWLHEYGARADVSQPWLGAPADELDTA